MDAVEPLRRVDALPSGPLIYSNRSRGRGGRGDRGGFSNRGRGGAAGHSSDNTSEFPLHPRSRFGKAVGITRVDLTVREVGFYSMHGDISDESTLELRNDKSFLRPLTLKCATSGETPVPGGSWNLDQGFSQKTTDERVRFRSGIPVLMKWLKDNAEDPRIQALREQVDFVSTNGILGDLMKVAYQKDSGYSDGWIFAAAKVKDKIIISHIARENLDSIFNRKVAPARTDDHSAFWGRRFEVYMTQQRKDEYGDRRDAAEFEEVGAPRYRSVVHAKLRDLNLLLEAGVDGADPFSQEGYPQKYVDFTIMPTYFLPNPRKFYQERMFRWWVSNVLAGTGSVRVGLHETGVVSTIRAYKIADIPQHVREKSEENGMAYWDPNVCLGFLYALLKYVRTKVVKDYNSAVYEFSCAKDGDGFVSKEIPTQEAAGHTYLTDDISSFLG
ncbi:hypothetical protein RvY_05787 [Ramazzottius varieornatus]|uniref:Decapping nuclease n=1 Tax=Ramazzottius varieornatus TaxID=947166 RepID=A0A1D1V2V9_RAMVA|nr:hypothetical protein RvY_05787 [Ramazzottius varieornatus]